MVYAVPYKPIAEQLAATLNDINEAQERIKQSRVSVWQLFKDSLSVAVSAGHTVQAFKVGMTLACNQAEIPDGSVRSYLATASSLYEDIMNPDNPRGTLTLAQVMEMAVADARKRFSPPPTEEQQARRALQELTADWSPEQLSALVEIAKGHVEPEIVETVEKAAEIHELNIKERDENKRLAA